MDKFFNNIGYHVVQEEVTQKGSKKVMIKKGAIVAFRDYKQLDQILMPKNDDALDYREFKLKRKVLRAF